MNQFINVAVVEKLARLQQDEWVESRSKPTRERIARALKMLDRPTGNAPQPGDSLPSGYFSVRCKEEYKQLKRGK